MKLFCEGHRELLAGAGLPAAVTHSEGRFRDLLEAGQVAVAGEQFALGLLTPAGWSALYRFAAVFFREFGSCAPGDLFAAFRREALCRGGEFPR